MRRAETTELLGIAVVVVGVAGVARWLPVRVDVGDVVLGAAALLLFHGLLRDLARVRAARRAAASSSRTVTCVCAESTIGVGVIVAGLVLVLGFTPIIVHVPPLAWPGGVLAVMLFGFLTRNLVLDWRERRLRWQSDHGVAVAWRK